MQKKHSHKKSNLKEYLLINVFVFAGIFLLSFTLLNVSLFDSFTQAFRDFTLTDLYYSSVINKDKIYAGPLVLVNIEHRSRAELATLIEKIEEGNPKVVGVDAIFADRKDSSDSLLHSVIHKNSNLVLPYIDYFDTSISQTKSDPYFQTGIPAFVNMIGDQGTLSTVRYYYPYYQNVPAFTTAILEKYDPSLEKVLLERSGKKTEIKYYGNLQNFMYKNFDEVLDTSFNLRTFKNKIVLLGYLGVPGMNKGDNIDEDRFFTPLNPKLSGRSLPDMYGLVVNANVVRMVLAGDFVYAFKLWQNWSLAFLLSLLFMPLFVKWYVHKAVWFHLFTILVQLLLSILFVFFTIQMYDKAHVKIESSALLVAILLIGDFLLFYDHLVKYLHYKLKWSFHSKFLESGH